jgi:hypothetical protein
MHSSSPVRLFLKWSSILWTIFAVGIVLISNIMIVYNWSPISGLGPFDVRDSFKVFLLLAPGAVGAAIDLFLGRARPAETSHSGKGHE